MPADKKFFIIIGAPKAGTTSLASWFDAHPDFTMGVSKEPRFFTDFAKYEWTGPASMGFKKTMILEECKYLASFERKPSASWLVDASTDYLWCPVSAGKIHEWGDRFDLKVVCILRDPVDRAISEHQHAVRDGYEDKTLSEALSLEPERFRSRWHPLFYHVMRSRYVDQIDMYLALLGDRMLLLNFEEMADPGKVMGKVSDFLGVTPPSIDVPQVRNKGYVHRSRRLSALMRSDAARRVGRLALPKSLRRRAFVGMESLMTKRFEASEAEIALLTDALGDELLRCEAHPRISTEGWRSLARARLSASRLAADAPRPGGKGASE